MAVNTRMIWPVQAPCLIAYRDPLTGYFWLRPYIDLHVKSKIWGIAVHGQVFKTVHEEDCSWNEAIELSDSKSRAKMPSTTVLDIVSVYVREFNATVEQLTKLNIKAEPWHKGWYWSSEDDGDNATVMDMSNGKIDFIPKKMKNGYVRLVSNYIVNKPDNLGYGLAYLIDGHLELSFDFQPKLKDKLWGLHVCKKYSCMKLTYEPQKLLVNDAIQLGQSLSNDELLVELPISQNVDDVARDKDGINDTLAKLSAYGVKVDLLVSRDMFWLTKSFYDNNRVFLSYGHRLIPATEACYCRLFAKNKGKTVVI